MAFKGGIVFTEGFRPEANFFLRGEGTDAIVEKTYQKKLLFKSGLFF